MKILDPKDAINRRQDEELIVVKTAIYRVSCLNRTVLSPLEWTSAMRLGIHSEAG